MVDYLTQMTLNMSHNDGLCKLLAVCLVSTVVFYLNMQVQRALAAVDFLAVFVRADILAINLFGRPSVVLFAIVLIVQSILFI